MDSTDRSSASLSVSPLRPCDGHWEPGLRTDGPDRSFPVVTCRFTSPQEWILISAPQAPAAAALQKTAPLLTAAPWTPQERAAVIRLGPPGWPPETGAILAYRRSRVVLYCPASQVSPLAAAALPAVADPAGIFSRPAPGAAPRVVTVKRVPCQDMPDPLHPAAAADCGDACNIFVCERVIAPELAQATGDLWTAHAQLLASADELAAAATRLRPCAMPHDNLSPGGAEPGRPGASARPAHRAPGRRGRKPGAQQPPSGGLMLANGGRAAAPDRP